MARERKTVTQGKWSVSVTTGTGIRGAILNVKRHFEPKRDGVSKYIMAKGDADGMLFPTTEAASEYAFEHGYTQEWIRGRGWCPTCRAQHVHHRYGQHPRPEIFCPVTDERI